MPSTSRKRISGRLETKRGTSQDVFDAKIHLQTCIFRQKVRKSLLLHCFHICYFWHSLRNGEASVVYQQLFELSFFQLVTRRPWATLVALPCWASSETRTPLSRRFALGL